MRRVHDRRSAASTWILEIGSSPKAPEMSGRALWVALRWATGPNGARASRSAEASGKRFARSFSRQRATMAVSPGGGIRSVHAEGNGGVLDHGLAGSSELVGPEGGLSGEQLVEDHSGGPDVGAAVDLAREDLLGDM